MVRPKRQRPQGPPMAGLLIQLRLPGMNGGPSLVRTKGSWSKGSCPASATPLWIVQDWSPSVLLQTCLFSSSSAHTIFHHRLWPFSAAEGFGFKLHCQSPLFNKYLFKYRNQMYQFYLCKCWLPFVTVTVYGNVTWKPFQELVWIGATEALHWDLVSCYLTGTPLRT